MAEFSQQEPVIVLWCDDEGLAVEPCCRPCEGSQELPAIAVEGCRVVCIDVFFDVFEDWIQIIV